MSGIGKLSAKVAIVESDRYALNAINAYLAWDRRTNVKIKVDSLEDYWTELAALAEWEQPDVVTLDANHVGGAYALSRAIHNLRSAMPGVMIICLAQFADLDLLHAAADASARAFLLKQDVGMHIGWAIYRLYTLDRRKFVISASALDASAKLNHNSLRRATVLPGPRRFPDLTDRKRQAIILYAIEGMPVRLVADEMGISTATVRGYIKLAYRILETYDECQYPADMSQQELAFMRLTALEPWEDGHDERTRKQMSQFPN